MKQKRDYYEVLGLPRDADQKRIKSAFRKLALKYHPDRSKEPDAEARFKEIAEAYGVLHDPKKRAEYDARGYAGVAGLSPEDIFGGIDFEDIFGGLGFDFGGGLFDRLFRGRARPRRGRHLEVELAVPLERVLAGGEETVRIKRVRRCTTCGGSGAKPGTGPRRCEGCGGTGRRMRQERRGGISFRQITSCPTCGGRGSIIEEACRECEGRGEVLREEKLALRIPIGVKDGMVLRVPGHGLPSAETEGAPGDLFVAVRTAPDERFAREGADLWRVEEVEVADAVLGTSLEVATLEGPVTLKVPPGTQPEEVLRLPGKGLPEFGGGGRGDLYVRVKVRLPDKPSSKERELYERLRDLAREGGRGEKRASKTSPSARRPDRTKGSGSNAS